MAGLRAAPLVWMNGFPGCGKLTIATAIVNMQKNVTLIDNHKLIDPVAARFSRDHPEYQIERKKQRQQAFEQYVYNPATAKITVIFTDSQSDNELGQSVANEYKDAAEKAGRPFIAVCLTCDLAENLERVADLDRVNSGTTKLVDAKILKTIRETCTLARIDQCFELTVDSTRTTPLDAATTILTFINHTADHLSLSAP